MKKNQIKYILQEYVNNKNVILTEQHLNEVYLNEGWKEVLLGIALLTGVGLNSAQSQTAKNALSQDDIKKKIEAVLQDTATLNKITKDLPGNIQDKIKANAEKALQDLEKGGEVVSTIKSKDGKQLASKLNQGYAITGVSAEKDTLGKDTTVVLYTDTIVAGFGNDNFFVTAGYELSEQGLKAIQAIKDSITNAGGKILNVDIESSTDKEPIKIGNEKLAQLRAESVADLFDHVGEITTLPDQGPDIYSHTMTDRDSARQKTASYRYVKLTLSTQFTDSVVHKVTRQILEKNTYTLIKTMEDKINTGGDFFLFKIRKEGTTNVVKHKKVNCKKIKCPKFGG